MGRDCFKLYNQLWNAKKLDRPLVVLIGGYCGAGKSTLAKSIQGLIVESTVIPTGIIRAVCKHPPGIKKKIYGCHTYDLYRHSKNDKELAKNYLEQTRILYSSIINLGNFAKSEMQNFIIEGNHIFPELKKTITQAYCVDVYLKATNSTRLIKNMTSITHPRAMDDNQMKTAIKLNGFVIKEIEKTDPTFEYNQQKQALRHIEKQLSSLISSLVQ